MAVHTCDACGNVGITSSGDTARHLAAETIEYSAESLIEIGAIQGTTGLTISSTTKVPAPVARPK